MSAYPERDPARLGQRQRLSRPGEERLAQLHLQLADLRRQRRRRDVQLLRGTGQVPLVRHGPEVVQVVVVEPERRG
ncbi:MAG: hypothetical protein U5K74_09425 [Gemmatimonadaceae bacterium]|nr:hypothetical protein [Gemmatimonadaceae bacterium]